MGAPCSLKGLQSKCMTDKEWKKEIKHPYFPAQKVRHRKGRKIWVRTLDRIWQSWEEGPDAGSSDAKSCAIRQYKHCLLILFSEKAWKKTLILMPYLNLTENGSLIFLEH